MINILSVAKTVYGGWNQKAVEAIDPAEITEARVTRGDYGLSVCFHLSSGQSVYHPLDRNASANEGDVLDVNKLSLVTLSKPGESDIYRVQVAN